MRTTDRPRDDLTATELGLAVPENLFDLFRVFARLPGGELEESDRLSRHPAFPGNPMFKGAWNWRLAADEVDGAVEDAVRWLEARRPPPSSGSAPAPSRTTWARVSRREGSMSGTATRPAWSRSWTLSIGTRSSAHRPASE
jgi:hypothetical protein